MNLLIFVPLALLIIPFIPTIIEIFKRKDRGPREIPEQTTYEEPPELEGISRIERARGDARARVTGNVIRITGNVSIPDEQVLNNHLVVQGTLKVGKKTHIYGSIKAFGDIELGEWSTVEGHVLSEGQVTVGRCCTVKGIVDSLKNIILEENAVVEAVSTEKTVRVGPNAKIKRRILSGASIVTFPQPAEEERPAKPEEARPAEPEIKEEARPSVSMKPSVKPPAVKRREVPFEVLDPEVNHLYLYAPTRYGKTYLIRNHIIPHLTDKKKIVVIDGHREYPFEPYVVNYNKTIPNVENDLFKTFITFNIWGDIEGIIEDMINHIAQSKGHVSIRPNIIDSNVEKLIMSEFLKRMTQVKWKDPILLIIEEADKYDVLSAVTRGRHANMQVILTSAKRLMPEVFSNVHLVLGSINPALIRDYDPYAAEAVATLGRHEFIWEKEYHDWRRFRLSPEPIRQIAPKPSIIEEKEHVEEMPIAPVVERLPSREAVSAPIPPKETMVEPVRLTDRIFEYLEERIRMLERPKVVPIEPASLESLTPIEAKVFKAAHKCRSSEEICLRYLLDPSEVEEAINSLMKKGYLDKDLKPIPSRRRSFVKKEAKRQIEQPAPRKDLKTKEEEAKERQKEQMPSEKDVIEKLIASKMREELKRKIEKTETESSIDVQKTISDKINAIQKAGREGINNVLKEWKKVSSLLWRKEEQKKTGDESASKSPMNVEETSAEKTDKKRGETKEKAETQIGGKSDE